MMNKSELIDNIAQTTGIQKIVAGKALDATIVAITDALRVGDTVAIVGFGTFTVKNKSARIGRNPKTGESMNIPAKKSPTFKAGKALKEIINR